MTADDIQALVVAGLVLVILAGGALKTLVDDHASRKR